MSVFLKVRLISVLKFGYQVSNTTNIKIKYRDCLSTWSKNGLLIFILYRIKWVLTYELNWSFSSDKNTNMNFEE